MKETSRPPLLEGDENFSNIDYFNALISNMADGIMLINKNYIITEANPAACRLLRLNRKDVIGKNCYTVSHKRTRRCFPTRNCPVKKVFESSKPCRVVHKHFDAAGNPFIVELTASPLFGKNGEVIQVLEISRDITERMKIEQKLEKYSKELEKRVVERTKIIQKHAEELALLQKVNNAINRALPLEKVLQIVVDGLTSSFEYDASGITLLDKNKRYLYSIAVSSSLDLIRKVEDFTGMTLKDYRTPLFEGSIYKKLVEYKEPLFTENIVKVFEHFTDNKDLRVLAEGIAEITGFKSAIGVPLTAGDKVIGILGVASSKKLTEEDVERLKRIASQSGIAIEKAKLENEIRESEKKFHSIFEFAYDGIFLINEEGAFTMVNKKACQMTGFSKEELLKMDIRELIMEEDFNTFNFNKGEDFVNETKIRRKNGEFIFVEQSIAPIVIGGKKYYQIIARDITEKKKLEKEKEKLVRQLYQADKLASIGLLAAGVAHSINNPLTSISLNAEILKRKIKDRDIKKKIETIEEQVNIVASITKSLLDFSMEIRSEDKMVDLNEIIKKDLETLSFSLKEIYVYKDLGKIPKIKGNASKLHQLFMNLFMNSIHAMPTGGNLKVSTVKEGVNVIVTVSDTGQGIPKEYLSKIFDPFFTTKEVGEGTGLGLSICHGIVKEHGGVIDVESELGKGTTFKIRFPVRS